MSVIKNKELNIKKLKTNNIDSVITEQSNENVDSKKVNFRGVEIQSGLPVIEENMNMASQLRIKRPKHLKILPHA